MKISFDRNKNYFKCYDEARGVAMNKEYILKTRKLNLFNYTDYMCMIFCILLCVSMSIMCIGKYDAKVLGILFIALDIIFLTITVVSTYYMYICRKKSPILDVIIDKEGITNFSFYNIKMVFNWDKIKAIVVKKNSVTILTDTPIYLYFDKSKENKVIREIKKYKPEIIILKQKKKKRT